MYPGNHTLSIIATAAFELIDDAALKVLEPQFVPLRGAKSAEKINEQKAEHSTNWQAAAQYIPHCVQLVSAHVVWYDSGYDEQDEADICTRMEMRVDSYESVAELMTQLNMCNLRKVRWIGDDTRLLAKYLFFEAASRGDLVFDEQTEPTLRNRFLYGCDHFEFDNLLERGKSLSVPRASVVHRLLNSLRQQLPEGVLAGDYLQLSTRLKEACFIAAGELPNLLALAEPCEVSDKALDEVIG